MIEPVFIGLLAAAFAFLYPQLLGEVRRYTEWKRKGWHSVQMMAYDRDGKMVMKRLKEVFGRAFRRIAWLLIGMSVALVLFGVSVSALVAGYWIDDDVLILAGLVLLVSAVLFCVVSLSVIQVLISRTVVKEGKIIELP